MKHKRYWIGKHKVLEVESGILFTKCRSFFEINVSWTRLVDHAGFYFYFSLFKFKFEINICDERHWDEKKGEWEVLPPKRDCEWDNSLGV